MKKIILGLLIGIIFGSFSTAYAVSIIFTDVPQDAWYSDSVLNLVERNIITGYEDDTFRPSDNVNRAELAVIIDRLLKNQRLTPKLSEHGVFMLMQSYEGCIDLNTTFAEVTDEQLKLETKKDGSRIWVADFASHYCAINEDTGLMEEYYFMEY